MADLPDHYIGAPIVSKMKSSGAVCGTAAFVTFINVPSARPGRFKTMGQFYHIGIAD
jgi:hypothetical protein